VLARAVRVAPEDGITLTERAADELFRNAREADAPGGVYVLAGVSPGGMAGYLYSLDLRAALAHPVGPEMRVFESRGVPIVTDEQSLASGHLRGHYIDWRTTSRGTGFEFFPYDPDARDEPDEPISRSDARDCSTLATGIRAESLAIWHNARALAPGARFGGSGSMAAISPGVRIWNPSPQSPKQPKASRSIATRSRR
jgi:Fe-S cluster assembly iron-binding protein IscA